MAAAMTATFRAAPASHRESNRGRAVSLPTNLEAGRGSGHSVVGNRPFGGPTHTHSHAHTHSLHPVPAHDMFRADTPCTPAGTVASAPAGYGRQRPPRPAYAPPPPPPPEQDELHPTINALSHLNYAVKQDMRRRGKPRGPPPMEFGFDATTPTPMPATPYGRGYDALAPMGRQSVFDRGFADPAPMGRPSVSDRGFADPAPMGRPSAFDRGYGFDASTPMGRPSVAYDRGYGPPSKSRPSAAYPRGSQMPSPSAPYSRGPAVRWADEQPLEEAGEAGGPLLRSISAHDVRWADDDGAPALPQAPHPLANEAAAIGASRDHSAWCVACRTLRAWLISA